MRKASSRSRPKKFRNRRVRFFRPLKVEALEARTLLSGVDGFKPSNIEADLVFDPDSLTAEQADQRASSKVSGVFEGNVEQHFAEMPDEERSRWVHLVNAIDQYLDGEQVDQAVPVPFAHLDSHTGDPPGGLIQGDDDRVPVSSSAGFPFTAIGRLVAQFPTGDTGVCSGAMIGPYHFLTAGHCIRSWDPGYHGTIPGRAVKVWVSLFQAGSGIGDPIGPGAGHMKFVRSSTQPWGQANATEWRVLPGWEAARNFHHDLGLVTLDRNIGNFAGSLGWSYVTGSGEQFYRNNTLTAVGYPRDKNDDLLSMYQESGFAADYDDASTAFYDGVNSTSGMLRSASLDVWPGMSGGPAYYHNPSTGSYSVHAVFSNHDPNPGKEHIEFKRITEADANSIIAWRSQDDAVRRPTDKADLVDSDYWFGTSRATNSASRIGIGDSFTATAYIRNNGTASTGNYTVRFRLSTDTTYDTSDILLGDVSKGSLSPFGEGTSATFSTAAFPGVANGTYYVVWSIDALSNVSEFEENDNKGYVTTPLVVEWSLTVTNTNDSGLGSLRGAILAANGLSGQNTILFNIPATDGNFIDVDSGLAGGDAAPDAFWIRPSAPLPTMTDRTIIDGRTQSSFGGNANLFGPEIVLDGNGLVVHGILLTSTASGSALYGLNIERFVGSGIFIEGASNVHVAANYIGTNATGTAAAGNTNYGVSLAAEASGNVIGTNGDGANDAAERNIISGNEGSGVALWPGVSNNVIAGNFIGLNAAGTAALGNLFLGVEVLSEASNNRIGTNADGVSDDLERNLVSANSYYGIRFTGSGTRGNVAAGNYVGTDVTGTLDLGNGQSGVLIEDGASNNTIGGNTAVARNIISGNGAGGIYIFGAGTQGNQVVGNYIGTDVSGTVELGNYSSIPGGGTSGLAGVYISSGATSNLVGGSAPGAGNVISGNLKGVWIHATGSSNNRVQGNYIGTTLSGALALPNISTGVEVSNGASLNVIGTDGDGLNDAMERNVISGNLADGVSLSHVGTQGNRVAGNYIGTDSTGTLDLGNEQYGIQISSDATENIVGTNGDGNGDLAERNIIAGNQISGIRLGSSGTNSNRIAGNYIGLDVTGSVAVGNSSSGVVVNSGAANNVIGTNGDGVGDAVEGNIIAGNLSAEISISFPSTGTVVAGNIIGLNVAGTAELGMGGEGIRLISGTTSNRIGTNSDGVSDALERNIISGNSIGVLLQNAGTTNNLVAGNYIGTDISGTLDLGNTSSGVAIALGATRNTIGGTTLAARNVISGNNGVGVLISGAGSDNNWVLGNYIGTNAAGTAALGNGSNGVGITGGAKLNFVGTNGDGTGDDFEGNLISGNTAAGIVLAGANQNIVAGNLIGTDLTGSIALPNKAVGVGISSGAQNNRIGTNSDGISDIAERNVISGNQSRGISIASTGTTQNIVAGNHIGTNSPGTAAVGNMTHGVEVSSGAADNVIGTNGDGIRDDVELNIISGNRFSGVALLGGSNNSVAGNYIGTDITGTTRLLPATWWKGEGTGDDAAGGSHVTTMVGATYEAGKVGQAFSFDGAGDYLTVPHNNAVDLGSVADYTIEGWFYVPAAGAGGIALSKGDADLEGPSWHLKVTDTLIELRRRDFQAASDESVVIRSGSSLVGSWFHVAVTRSGASYTVYRNGSSLGGASGSALYSNSFSLRIGGQFHGGVLTSFNGKIDELAIHHRSLNSAEIAAIAGGSTSKALHGNAVNGVDIQGAQGNRVGTNSDGVSDALERNIISGNRAAGVQLLGTLNTVVAGNYIGTDVTGTSDLGNTTGVLIGSGATDNTIGGSSAASRNVISGNDSHGVSISSAGTSINRVLGNFIGTDASGQFDLGNTMDGVRIQGGATNNTVGGSSEMARNVISGNNSDGIEIANAGTSAVTSGNRVQGNFIGTNVNGSAAVGNSRDGIAIGSDSQANIVGTDADGTADALEGNLISGNLRHGVSVTGATSAGNAVRGNAIYSNGGLGIDLAADGVTANDLGDVDAGPNGLINFPSMNLTTVVGSTVRFIVTLNGESNAQLTIEFFASGAADPSGHGEGELFLEARSVTTGPDGNATFEQTFTGGISAGQVITATITDAAGNTSEFSAAVDLVNDAPTLAAIPDPAAILEDATLQTIDLTGISAGPNELQTLSVTATSNNPGLIPSPTVNYTSPSATGDVSYAPVANQWGTAVITLTLRDAGLDGIAGNADDATFSQSFTVTVTPVNDEPALDAIADPAVILEDAGEQTVQLGGISAGPNESQTLTITATSSNPDLVPHPTVNYGSPSAVGSLSYTPQADLSGAAVIAVTVRDAGLDGIAGNADDAEFSQTFNVTVTPVNDSPTLDAVADAATILKDAALQTINLTGISAGPNELQTLSVTATSSNPGLIPSPDVNYADGADSGSLSFTPEPNQSGIAVIIVTLRDAGLDTVLGNADDATSDHSFTVTVVPVNDPPSFNVGPGTSAPDDSGTVVVEGFATNVTMGPSNEGAQTPLEYVVMSNSNPGVFAVQPWIDVTGVLMFKPAPNIEGTAEISVVLRDNGGLENDGVDTSGPQTFAITIWKPHSASNAANQLDVDNSGGPLPVSAADALVIINVLNLNLSGGNIPASSMGETGFYYDTNKDDFVSAIDVVIVFNYLNAIGSALLGGEGEGAGAGARGDSQVARLEAAAYRAGVWAPEEPVSEPANSSDIIAMLAVDVAGHGARRRKGGMTPSRSGLL